MVGVQSLLSDWIVPLLSLVLSMRFGLKTQEGVLSYLTQHLALDADIDGIKRLSGGFVNVTWRIALNCPYRGHTSIILKHAQGHLSSDENFKIGVERSAYEYQALNIVSEVLRSYDTLVAVPQGLYYDAENNVLIMQDVGKLKTLVDYLTSKPPLSLHIASLIGSHIGEAMARLHNLGRAKRNDPDFKFFSGNTVGRTTAKQLYETMIPFAAKHNIDDPILPKVVQELIDEVMTSEETFIMADLWSGNILLDLEENSNKLKQIWVVDWELCKYGPVSLDLGYFLGDCFLVTRFQDEQVGTTVRKSFINSYAQVSDTPINYKKVVKAIGAHIVMWTDFMGWGNEEERRIFIKKGVEAFHEAEKNEDGEITSLILPSYLH